MDVSQAALLVNQDMLQYLNNIFIPVYRPLNI